MPFMDMIIMWEKYYSYHKYTNREPGNLGDLMGNGGLLLKIPVLYFLILGANPSKAWAPLQTFLASKSLFFSKYVCFFWQGFPGRENQMYNATEV